MALLQAHAMKRRSTACAACCALCRVDAISPAVQHLQHLLPLCFFQTVQQRQRRQVTRSQRKAWKPTHALVHLQQQLLLLWQQHSLALKTCSLCSCRGLCCASCTCIRLLCWGVTPVRLLLLLLDWLNNHCYYITSTTYMPAVTITYT